MSQAINTYEEDNDNWKVGDVYRDLHILEKGIILETADARLQQDERIEMLHHLAKAKRPVLPDVQKFVLAPLSIALSIRILYPIIQHSNWGRSLSLFMKIVMRLLNVQFWTMVVSAPIVLLLAKRCVMPPPEAPPKELVGMPENAVELLDSVDYEPPGTSCRDYVLFLLEYWTSAVATTAALGLLRIATERLWPALPSHSWLVGSVSQTLKKQMGIVQFLTRIAAVASLYQNPKQVFQLQRSMQPRPMTFFPTILQPLVSAMLWVLPLGLTTDWLLLLMGMPMDSVAALYSTLAVVGLGTWARMENVKSLETENGSEGAVLRRIGSRKQWIYAVVALIFWRRPFAARVRGYGLSAEKVWQSLQMPISKVPRGVIMDALSRLVLWASVSFISLIGPCIHIRSLAKRFRVGFMHDISLALDADEVQKAVNDDSYLQSRRKWRYRLEWRDDEDTKRLAKVYQTWKDRLYYWLFHEGKPAEKIAQMMAEEVEESSPLRQSLLQNRIPEEVSSMKSMNISTYTPRDEWQKKAMKMLADKHQHDYDRKSFDDPLGVALHQSLGIGLGFNFDHDRPLKKGEKPSLLRLQARAAKSAIRRAQELRNAKAAIEELNKISDPKEKNARKRELRRRSQGEIEFLAARMTELLPPPSASGYDEFRKISQFKRFQEKEYRRVSSRELVTVDPMDSAKSIENDLVDFGFNVTSHEVSAHDENITAIFRDSSETNSSQLQKLQPYSSGAILSNPNNKTLQEEDEFLNAYLEQQRGTLSGIDENENDTTIMLA